MVSPWSIQAQTRALPQPSVWVQPWVWPCRPSLPLPLHLRLDFLWWLVASAPLPWWKWRRALAWWHSNSKRRTLQRKSKHLQIISYEFFGFFMLNVSYDKHWRTRVLVIDRGSLFLTAHQNQTVTGGSYCCLPRRQGDRRLLAREEGSVVDGRAGSVNTYPGRVNNGKL